MELQTIKLRRIWLHRIPMFPAFLFSAVPPYLDTAKIRAIIDIAIDHSNTKEFICYEIIPTDLPL